MTRIAILGEGARAAQIAAEFALGGCSVEWLSAEQERSQLLAEESLRMAAVHGLAAPADLERARALLGEGHPETGADGRLALIVEALPAELDAQAEGIARLAAAHPEALGATTSEARSVTPSGGAGGRGRRSAGRRVRRPAPRQPH